MIRSARNQSPKEAENGHAGKELRLSCCRTQTIFYSEDL